MPTCQACGQPHDGSRQFCGHWGAPLGSAFEATRTSPVPAVGAPTRPSIVLAVFAALFTADFGRSNLGALFARKGATLLQALQLPGQVTIVGIIIATAMVNLLIGSASARRHSGCTTIPGTATNGFRLLTIALGVFTASGIVPICGRTTS